MNYSYCLLVGVCSCFTFSTALSVLRRRNSATSQVQIPRSSDFELSRVLAFRPLYYFSIVGFPILVAIIDVVVILKLDAVKPSDDLHCDATNPLWYIFLMSLINPFTTNAFYNRVRFMGNFQSV